jgi:Holliday junction resolvasome RuvABC endonuclease subunit
LAEWSLQWISAAGCSRVAIEGYAFGAVGRVFQIAENCGLLKYKLWKQGIPYSVPAPTEIKKFATGKGNANKDMMLDSFKEETGVDIRVKLDIIKGYNPISDIVDAYFIAKFEHFNGSNNDSNI